MDDGPIVEYLLWSQREEWRWSCPCNEFWRFRYYCRWSQMVGFDILMASGVIVSREHRTSAGRSFCCDSHKPIGISCSYKRWIGSLVASRFLLLRFFSVFFSFLFFHFWFFISVLDFILGHGCIFSGVVSERDSKDGAGRASRGFRDQGSRFDHLGLLFTVHYPACVQRDGGTPTMKSYVCRSFALSLHRFLPPSCVLLFKAIDKQ